MQCYEVHAEIRRINSKITCYYSVQKLLPYSLFKCWKSEHKRTTILPLLLYGSETWYLILRKHHKLHKCFETKCSENHQTLRGWRQQLETLHNEENDEMVIYIHHLLPHPSNNKQYCITSIAACESWAVFTLKQAAT